jgi:hypothetical protein
MRLWPWRRQPRPAEHDLDERGEEVSRELVERGMRDLDERPGLLGRLERRLPARDQSDRRRES